MQEEALNVKKLAFATCFVRVTNVPAHLDKINRTELAMGVLTSAV